MNRLWSLKTTFDLQKNPNIFMCNENLDLQKNPFIDMRNENLGSAIRMHTWIRE